MIIAIIYFGGGMALIIGTGQIIRGLNTHNITLCLFFICLGIRQLMAGLFYSGTMLHYPMLLLVFGPLNLLLGPLLYLYFRSLVEDRIFIKPVYLLHFLLPLLVFLYLSIYFVADPDIVINIIRENRNPGGSLVVNSIFFLTGISIILYTAFFVSRIIPIQSISTKKGGNRIIIWTLILITFIITGFGIATLIFKIPLFRDINNSAATVLIVLFYLAGQKYPHLLNNLAEHVQKKYHHSQLSGVDLELLGQKLDSIMDEKIYCDEDITLSVLSGMLNINSHQLSQYLNEHRKKNFNTFINEYRVLEASRMLLEEPDRNVLSIGLAVGFNSNSVFHSAFDKIYKMSPGKYRKTKNV